MRLKVVPEDFLVEEQLGVALATEGSWAIYRVRKRGITTLEAQSLIRSNLGIATRRLVFPALKDRDSVAIQYASVLGGHRKAIRARGLEAWRTGFLDRPLRGSDVQGNKFRIVVRDMSKQEAYALQQAIDLLAQQGFPNYYDKQRFGSVSIEGEFIARAIFERDAEKAVRMYLTVPFVGDPRRVSSFKCGAASLWPDWKAMMDIAPRPSNFRSLLTFLKDHPADFRRALNLIPQRVLSIYLSAYQAYLWNRVVAFWLEGWYQSRKVPFAHLTLLSDRLPLHLSLALRDREILAGRLVPMPNHRAAYSDPDLARVVERVLDQEGLHLSELKARILKRAYLARGQRAVLCLPRRCRCRVLVDSRFPGRWAVESEFALPRGSYATLLIKSARTLTQATEGN